MKAQLEAYFTKRYGVICDELYFAMALTDLTVTDFDTVLTECLWIFSCEWDCGLDDWYTEILHQEINNE